MLASLVSGSGSLAFEDIVFGGGTKPATLIASVGSQHTPRTSVILSADVTLEQADNLLENWSARVRTLVGYSNHLAGKT